MTIKVARDERDRYVYLELLTLNAFISSKHVMSHGSASIILTMASLL